MDKHFYINVLKNKKIFLTGGAGFIGSHILEVFKNYNQKITVFDNLSSSDYATIKPFLNDNIKFIEGNILNAELLNKSMKDHDLVWHLAANTDIIGSHLDPSRDLKDCLIGTFQVMEAMKANSIRELIFASSGAVYGNICKDEYVSESAGPLLPISTYGAGKLSCEAFIASFCHNYNLRAWIYRFGNVIGNRMTHGVIYDFIKKLNKNPNELLIKGDGTQEKNYFLVEECIHGMLFGYANCELDEEYPCKVLNLGTSSITKVVDIADIIIDELDHKNTKVVIEGAEKAWPGDQPRVHFKVDNMKKLGWESNLTSDESVKIATQRMIGKNLDFIR